MPFGVDYAEPELRLAKAIADELKVRGIFTVQGLNMTYGADYSEVEKRQAIAIADMFVANKIGATQPWVKVSPIGGGWANLGGNYSELAYTTEGNDLRIRGTISGGTSGTTLFTLPLQFRPAIGEPVPVAAFNGLTPVSAFVLVNVDGTVILNTSGTTFVGIQVRMPLS